MQVCLPYKGRHHIQVHTGQGWEGVKRYGEAVNGERKALYGD